MDCEDSRPTRDVFVNPSNEKRITKDNEESEKKIEENPIGINSFPDSDSYTFWVRIVDSSTGEEDSYEEMKVKVNTIGTVFTVVNHNDISSVTHSFSLSDVIHENERIDQGRCCEGISEIRDGL